MSQTDFQGIKNVLEISYCKIGELYAIKDTDKAIQAFPDTRDRGTSMKDITAQFDACT
jgi:hypothetical protein